jgi:glutaredoxin
MIAKRQMPKITLYTRPGCHLCENASALLQRLGWKVDEVNIDADPELRRRYGYMVPVLTADGNELLWGIFTEAKVRAALAGWSPC